MAKYQDRNSSITQHSDKDSVTVTGGCHCQAVRFIAQVPQKNKVLTCNCSVCLMSGFKHLIASHSDFHLISGKSKLTKYQFNTHQAKHLFCQICGVKSFYQPRSHPNSWSINTNCIDSFNQSDWEHQSFDGKNWEQAKTSLDQ